MGARNDRLDRDKLRRRHAHRQSLVPGAEEDGARRRRGASLAVLFYFKYAAFLVNSVTSLFGVSFSIPVLELPSAAGASGMSVLGAWYISVLYSLQLYFDFPGYSDMAIGMGRIFGFTYKENFNYPYISKSASEFWHRWHISLGSFFRDYVYVPLGGNRRGRARTALNLAIVWALTGLWHGASWNFVIWGLYYGVLIILEKLVLADFREKLPGAAQHIAALFLIVVGWTVFYYTDMGCLGKHLGAMFGIGAAGLSDPVTMAVIRKYTVLPLIAAIASLPILPQLKAWLGKHEKLEGAADIVSLVCLTALMLLSMIFIVGQSYNPFIYFRF